MAELLQIPGYRIEEHIGSGAMAKVYAAIQIALERRVALKLMTSSLVADDTIRERFRKEGTYIAQLNHPNIITIYDSGEFQSCYYMAMEYVSGGTLKERIQQGLTAEQALELMRQIAGALGYAHSRGYVHRDVKPANILFRDEHSAVLSDFGIAKAFTDATQITATGWTVGTPNYMSPEQALGKEVDSRSDLYSLGVVFYEMLTGKKPYQSQDSFATALMHVNDPIPRLPRAQSVYQDIVDHLMAKAPADRYASAEELIAVIDSVGSTSPTVASAEQEQLTQTILSPMTDRKDQRGQKKAPRWLMVFGLLIPAAGAAALYQFFPEIRELIAQTPSPAPRPPLNEASQKEVAKHLENAKIQQEVDYLIYPYTLNATYFYCLALKLDPKNAKARAGLDAVAVAYSKIAPTNLRLDELPDSLQLVENCLTYAPNHKGLHNLRERIKQDLEQARS